MDGFEWTPTTTLQAAAVALSLIAVGISAYSLSISRKVLRRDIKAEEPLLYAKITLIQDRPNWYRVDLTLQSRSSYGWRATQIDYGWCGRGLTWQDAHVAPKPGGPGGIRDFKSPLPQTAARRRMNLDFGVAAAGVTASRFGNIKLSAGDNHCETVVVFARCRWSRTLSMRISLASMESIERRMVIVVRRTLPQAPKTATA